MDWIEEQPESAWTHRLEETQDEDLEWLILQVTFFTDFQEEGLIFDDSFFCNKEVEQDHENPSDDDPSQFNPPATDTIPAKLKAWTSQLLSACSILQNSPHSFRTSFNKKISVQYRLHQAYRRELLRELVASSSHSEHPCIRRR